MKRFGFFGARQSNNSNDETTQTNTSNVGGEGNNNYNSAHAAEFPEPPPPLSSQPSSERQTLFRGFGGSPSSAEPATNSAVPSTNIGSPSVSRGGGGGAWGGFRSSGGHNYLTAAKDDVKMERIVAVASRKFGDGVQHIVVSAKTKQPDSANSGEQWKHDLLELLGAGTDEQKNQESHIDTLLANSKCEKFVLRCLENELPPNLIHCLRLLRVLELQNASSAVEIAKQQHQDEEEAAAAVEPVSLKATEKVSKLLCLLCTDTSVGEQLRPHLFGLLALSGASYPPSGVHVAAAASQVIVTFAEKCLNRQLVWFIHDRKMMVHMTDDVKELSGMLLTSNTSPDNNNTNAVPQTVPLGLTGIRAEKAGLIVIALSTVVKLVRSSLNHESVDLVKDFESAGGYDVLQYAIYQATGENGKKLMELFLLLACCPNEYIGSPSVGDNDAWKLACNIRIFDIQGDLLMRANPLLRAWERLHVNLLGESTHGEDFPPDSIGGQKHFESLLRRSSIKSGTTSGASSADSDEIDSADDDAEDYGSIANVDLANPGSLKDLASLSIVTAAKLRASNSTEDEPQEDDVVFQFDLSHELLAITLQLIADHPNNYEILEERLHILSYYLLALPCYDDDDLKDFILKTLEFVLTGVGMAEEVTPMNACVEIFSALMQTLLKGDVTISEADAGQIVVDKEKILNMLILDADRLVYTLEKLLQFDQRVATLMVESGILTTNIDTLSQVITHFSERRQQQDDGVPLLPPLESPLDRPFALVCRVLKLLAAYHRLDSSVADILFISESSRDRNSSEETSEKIQLHQVLRRAVTEMGIQATHEAAGVFESYMLSYTSIDSLRNDIRFSFCILEDLTNIDLSNNPSGENDYNDIIHASILQREIFILSMLRSVLEAKIQARDSFRECGGFESVLKLIVSLKGIVSTSSTIGPKTFGAFLATIQMSISLIDAAIGMKSKIHHSTTDVSPVAIHSDIAVDYVSSRFSSNSSSSNNRTYIRQKRFYLNLAAALASTGLLESEENAKTITEYCFAHLDPTLKLSGNQMDVQDLLNPDAVRLLFGIAVFLPSSRTGNPLAIQIFDNILSLCKDAKNSTTLPQLATCGICHSLVNPKEFGPLICDREHNLSPKFVELLIMLAACNMSYTDFISLLRNVAGPVLITEGITDGRVRLPVISSSIRGKHHIALKTPDEWTEAFEHREHDFAERLQILCDIAANADSVPRVKLGGDSVNTIAVLKHQVRLDERLRACAEEGRLTYLEVESVDASALSKDVSCGSATPPSTTTQAGEKLWAPLTGSGFTYSIWLRHEIPAGNSNAGNIYILDLCSPSASTTHTTRAPTYLGVWYDTQNQRFNVMSSASYRGEPTCFPVSPLIPYVWHHIMITYTPAKRSMFASKSVFSIYVDGRALEAEVKVDSVNLPPNSRVLIGAPNPALSVSGVVRGLIPHWELGPSLLLSNVLLDLDATAIYAYGAAFPCLLWGDRPERLSLASTGSALFAQLAETREAGSVASALRRREISKLEGVGYCSMAHNQKDDLSTANLFCSIPPDCVIFGFQAGTIMSKLRNESKKEDRRLRKERIVNAARLNYGNESVSTDAIVYGRGNVCAPFSFKDSLRFVGGPSILLPLVNAATSPETLALSLQMIRLGCQSHRPNLEMMQAGGGYRMLSVLLQGKGIVDERCLDQCLAFAIHGFEPDPSADPFPLDSDGVSSIKKSPSNPFSNSREWVLSDIDAMKHLLMNHQVWDLRKYGPSIPLRLLSVLNLAVDHKAVHRAFNARRLHLVGIVKWVIHLAIEAAELFTAALLQQRSGRSSSNAWYTEAPLVECVAVGGDPGNPFLLDCRKLLRRVLTFMLTPSDLESLVESIVYTVFINGSGGRSASIGRDAQPLLDDRMLPGSTMRLHLVRLLEELIVDGVNEIVASGKTDAGLPREDYFQPHVGGVASLNQPYFTASNMGGKAQDGSQHPKHQQAQAFLKAFSSFLTPVWFATVLEGCREEATASALFRLMILLLQGSSAFETSFRICGGFSPFVLSIPKFSTCPSITISMLSQLLNFPILHLHSLPQLDAEQLCEVFDTENEESSFGYSDFSADPSTGIFALLVECVGRNVHLISSGSDLAIKASATNMAIVKLLLHRHTFSPTFRKYCCTPGFLEPLSQALCLVYDERIQHARSFKRQSLLADIPKDLTPTERYVGAFDDPDSTGVGIVRLLRIVIKHSMTSGPRAAVNINSIFRAFPIHASPQQVEAFHLILIEHCCAVIEGVLQKGNAVSVANCLGVCSVFLDQMLGGFFTSEAALKAVQTSVMILSKLLKFEEPAIYNLDNAEHTLLSLYAAHLANLTCVTALRLALPFDRDDRGDEDLQSEILQVMDSDIASLLLLPSKDRKSNWKIPVGKLTKPSLNSKLYPVWESSSIARCQDNRETPYPDAGDIQSSDAVTVAPLLVSLHRMLLESREDVRSLAISVLVALLQYRSSVLSTLLVVELNKGDSTETIDIISRGGFRALLAAHEAATLADKSSAMSVKRKYSSFFEWMERNRRDVEIVFGAVEQKACDLFPRLENTAIPQNEAVLNEQKLMLVQLTTQANDRTMLGSLERAELSLICSERTAGNHTKWKRQGFDDLAYGAMKWKILLRQLKGSSSIWEGGPRYIEKPQLTLQELVAKLDSGIFAAEREDNIELVKRWKLDLTEGRERQRRRLLPNYEFHGLYNLDENAEHEYTAAHDAAEGLSAKKSAEVVEEVVAGADYLVNGGEVLAEFLKDIKVRNPNKKDQEEDYDENEMDTEEDGLTVASTTTSFSHTEVDSNTGPGIVAEEGRPTAHKQEDQGTTEEDEVAKKEEKDSSSYELITGLLQAGDWPEKSYNIRRCNGLEVTQALLLWCGNAIYVIDGFEQTGGGGMDGRITRVERERSSFYISLRPKDFSVRGEDESGDELNAAGDEKNITQSSKHVSEGQKVKASNNDNADTTSEVIYEHRSQRILLADLYAVYRRRYQLQQSALEFYDVHRNAVLIAFEGESEREEVLGKVLQAEIPNSIFSSSYGTYINYAKFMRNLKQKIITQWQSGKMTNFEFLMHLNSFAGRSFNDLTQYPVFPWVIADYESEEIDLNDPKTYRDLSKPMGAIGEERAVQFRERYEALASTEFSGHDPPPFHYGTHYSCAAYVLYYLMRLEPFSRLALALQGGKFDFADRLFHDIGRSWKSASSENLQDVRELIPEFFYLPDFLVNTNNFDFGETQRGKPVHDVSLPKWAKGDPKRFIRINRQALESEYVSRNLHLWIDLIFGYKQRGDEAVKALNTFVHVTYEGVVDIDAMEDPVQRQSTIAQIQNFGQTPSRLERSPFPKRTVCSSLKDNSIDFGSLNALAPLTPSLCVAGAPHRVDMMYSQSDVCRLGLIGQADNAVGDMCLNKGQIIAVPRMCSLIVPSKKYYRFGGLNNGLSIHAAAVTPRFREVNKVISIHDDLHGSPIMVGKPSKNGSWVITGAADSTIRVWYYNDSDLSLRATLCGHDGSQIKCLDVSTECGVIVSGCGRGKVLMWDLRTLTFIRPLRHMVEDQPAVSVSINHSNGNVVTLVGSKLSIFDINGSHLASYDSFESNQPTCAVATDCPEWMERGVVAVTGHTSGSVCLWSIDYDAQGLILRHVLEGNPHSSPITALQVTGTERQDTLLIGDCTGKISVFKTVQLDNYNSTELSKVVDELKAMKKPKSAEK